MMEEQLLAVEQKWGILMRQHHNTWSGHLVIKQTPGMVVVVDSLAYIELVPRINSNF
jgi:hypothetical protein